MTINKDVESLNKIGKPIIVATHPRSGTHLVIDFLRKQFQPCKSWKYLGETKNNLYLDIDPVLFSSRVTKDPQQFSRRILQRAERPLIKTHCIKPWLDKHSKWANQLVSQSDILYIVRDGRDVLCSLHLFAQGYDPEARCSLSEFIHKEKNGVSRPKKWANHVLEWLNTPNVHVFRFEEIVKNTHQTLEQIGEALDMKPLYVEPLLPKPIRSRWESWWLSLTQLSPESTTHMGFSKHKKAQKWRTAFSQEDCEFFHQEAGELLLQLGYESSSDWINRSSSD